MHKGGFFLQGKIIDQIEGMYSDILIIQADNGQTYESRGFINGRNELLWIGDNVKFILEKNSINSVYYALDIMGVKNAK